MYATLKIAHMARSGHVCATQIICTAEFTHHLLLETNK